MKSPMNQRPDDQARELTEKFIAKHARTAAPVKSAAVKVPAPRSTAK
jgi:myo-inositol-1-phosphate synthase